MNFYAAQDQARKQSFILVLLFAVAVSILVILTNFCVAFFVLYSNPEHALNGVDAIGNSQGNLLLWVENLIAALGWHKFLWVTAVVVGGIGLAILFKWLEVREGGSVVAESLGGRPVLTNTSNALEKRLLNVVEEIAIAAGIPVPQVYLLEKEQGINAFAAGLESEDAVIGVTQGCLDSFNREQLQGVIAHEFSHILNGDMRLNIKLHVVLHGILLIGESGRLFMRLASESGRHSRRGKNGGVIAGLFVFGLSLWALGSIGQLFARIIKSAVSRQREYLADASAVQFTRNPQGIGEALAVIGGARFHSQVSHHHAHELSHLFFSKAGGFTRSFNSFFATHPPLDDRIKRIWPSWNGQFLEGDPQFSETDVGVSQFAASNATRASDQGQTSVAAGSAGYISLDKTSADKSTLPPIDYEGASTNIANDQNAGRTDYQRLADLAHEPSEAVTLILALLCDSDESIKNSQLTLIEQQVPTQLKGVRERLNELNDVSLNEQLQLVELSVPSLKSLSKLQYIKLRQLSSELVQADGKVDLREWLFFQLLKQHCDRRFGLSKPQKAKFKQVQHIAEDYQVVLSRLVHAGDHEGEEARAFARGTNASGLYNLTLLHEADCRGETFTRSIKRLSLVYPLLKPRLLKGLVASAKSNEELNSKEYCLVKGMAAIMDCPLFDFEMGPDVRKN